MCCNPFHPASEGASQVGHNVMRQMASQGYEGRLRPEKSPLTNEDDSRTRFGHGQRLSAVLHATSQLRLDPNSSTTDYL
jgi:hypothetical protein